MSRRRLALVAAALSALVLGAAPVAADGPVAEGYLEEWREDNHVPGVAAAVIDGDAVETVLLGTDGDGAPVTPTTPFLIGSVAKTVTSTIVLRLVEEGLLTLDEPARDHLPWLDHPATVRQLLTHTAGYTAADGLAVSERYAADVGVTEAARSLDRSGEAGTYRYSSAGYLVLGALVEAVTGAEFAEAVHTYVTGPAGMVATDVVGQGSEVPPGHRLWWGRAVAYDPGPEPSDAPYGYLVSTLEDLVAYARAHLDGDLVPEDLRAEAWAGTGGDRGYGLGWRLDDAEGPLRVHHTGATPGYFAHVMLMPDEGRAVVVLANAYSEVTAPSLAVAAADLDRLGQGLPAGPAPGGALPMGWLALIPVGLAAVLIAGLVLRRPRSVAIPAVLTAVALVMAGALLAVPSLLGMSWRLARIWAPDAALALTVGVIAWLLLAAYLALLTWRTRQRRTASPALQADAG